MAVRNSGHYGQIIASLSSGVIAVDRAGKVLTVNDAARQHLDSTPETLHEGADFHALDGVEEFISAMDGVLHSGDGVFRREIQLPTPEGPRTLGLTVSPIPGPEKPEGAIFLFTDLTEVRRLEKIAEVNRQLAQIGELTAGVVHELRNPLSVVSGMAELLIRKLEDDDGQQSNARAIFQEAGRMDNLVTQFLSFARPFELTLCSTSPQEIVHRTLALCDGVAREKNVTIESECGASLPAFKADPDILAQALGNIVRNAIEVMEKAGGVRLITRCENDAILFRVEDDGPGIHLAPGEELFSAFFSKREGGTGLGLSIAQRGIAAHGGTIEYGNHTGGGAFFDVRVPIKAATQPEL